MEQTKPMFGRLLRPPAWKRSGTILVERKGQKKKIVKANEKRKKGKVKKSKR